MKMLIEFTGRGKSLKPLLMALLLSMAGMTNALAQSFTVGNLNYSINADGNTVTLIGHVDGQNAMGTLTIPESVIYNTFNYPVTAIENNAFDGCTGLTGDLYIGNHVETIGDEAFYGCTGFTGDLHLGNNVTTVGNYAFYGCTGFSGELIIDHELASVGSSAFYNCSNLMGSASVVLTGTVGSNAFRDCTGITSVTIGDAVTTIPSRAFFGCSNLATVTIGEGVTSVAGYSFWNCPSITTVNFNATNCTSMETTISSRHYSVFHTSDSNNAPTPIVTLNIGENVTHIPRAAFHNSPNMTGVYFGGTIAQWCGIIFDSNPLVDGHNLYINNALVTSLTIPQGVTAIPNNAFYGCTSITSLNISNSVTSIGTSAFYGCSSLNSATISNSVTTINSNTFYGCSSLTSVTIPNSVTSIGNSAFYGCNSLTSVTIPNSVTSIGAAAFYDCSGLTSLTLGNSVTTIDNYAFNNCSNLTGNLTIPNSVIEIGGNVFNNCSSLSSVTLGSSIESIFGEAFYNCTGLTAVYYSGTIAQWCGINFLTEKSNPLYYGHNLYLNGALVTELTIPEGTTAISKNAFCGGTCINMVNIPNSVVSIGEYAFYNCAGIAVHYSGTIAQWCGITFNGDASNPLKNGYLYIDGALVTNMVIPYGVTAINPYAFYCCTSITGTLTLPNSLNTIGDYAFQGCTGFTGSLTIPNSVTGIGANAFEGCSGFTGSLTLGTGLYSLTYYSFGNCTGFTTMNYNATDCYFNGYLNFVPFSGMTSLTKLNIGSNVQSLAHIKFTGCGSVTSINVLAETPPSMISYTNTFSGVSTSTRITVPCGTLNDYLNATGWNSFTNIRDACELLTYSINSDSVSVTVTGHVDGTAATGTLVIPESKTINGVTYAVTAIGNYAFRNCTGFTGDLTIPNSVTDVGIQAFQSCSGFTGNLTIGNSVTTIGSNAFRNCTGLTGSLVLPDSVTSIGNYAFMNCIGFTGNLILGNSVSYIGTRAFGFQNTGNFTGSLVLPDSVTEIGNGAFWNCSGLTGNLTIPASVTSLTNAFEGCTGFTSLTLLWDIPISGSVGNINYDIPVTVPCGSMSLYQYAPNWINFSNYQEDCSDMFAVSATANPSDGGSVIFRAEGETLFSDSFEEYTVGNALAAETIAAGHDWWNTWDNNPGGEKDGLVAEYDGTQCGHLTYGNDQLLLLGNKESGVYDLEFDILVPDGKNAFFSILHQFNNGTAYEAVKFHLHVSDSYYGYPMPGQGIINADSRLAFIPCVYDAWMHFRVHVDIDADIARFYFTNSGEEELCLCQWQWSRGAQQNGDGTLAAMDFWPPMDAETSEFYVDNISLKQFGGEASNRRGTVRASRYFAPGSTCVLTAIPEEGYTFANWKKDGVVVSTEQTYSFTVTENAALVANFVGDNEITQTVNLIQGSNWFSTYVDITLEDLQNALVAALPSATNITIKGRTQSSFYNGTRWRGALSSLDHALMYQITVPESCEITLEGMPIDPAQHPVTIKNGPNWIGFPFSESMTPTVAFGNFPVSGDKIQSKSDGQATYSNRWRGALNALVPGQGYIYQSNSAEDRILVFPSGAK